MVASGGATHAEKKILIPPRRSSIWREVVGFDRKVEGVVDEFEATHFGIFGLESN
jgi:hypothetical protein